MSTRQYPVQCVWHLGTDEVKDYTVNVANEVQPGETITGVTVIVEPDGELTVGIPIVDATGLLISVQFSTPSAGKAYNIIYRCQTGIGKVFDVPIMLAGVDKSK